MSKNSLFLALASLPILLTGCPIFGAGAGAPVSIVCNVKRARIYLIPIPQWNSHGEQYFLSQPARIEDHYTGSRTDAWNLKVIPGGYKVILRPEQGDYVVVTNISVSAQGPNEFTLDL